MRTTDPREYHAIEPKDRNPKRSVEYRMRDGRRYWLKHTARQLMALSPEETSLVVFYPTVNVVMQGRALGAIADAIDAQNVAWVQEWDATRWDRPTDDRAAFVERMELYQRREEDGGDLPRATGMDGAEGRARH